MTFNEVFERMMKRKRDKAQGLTKNVGGRQRKVDGTFKLGLRPFDDPVRSGKKGGLTKGWNAYRRHCGDDPDD